MNFVQQPVVFGCENERLVGIISRPQQPSGRGVVIAVGGPQYRVGSHRQFLLLANHLAAQGTPVIRFDYRGMGDSSGDARDFGQVTLDMRAAIDAFFNALPELREVVLWGLCDAASAALFYAYEDTRVSGLVLLNPWVRTAQGEARAYLRHYYLKRLLSLAPWRKLLSGEFGVRDSWKSLISNFRKARGAGDFTPSDKLTTARSPPQAVGEALPQRMADGFARFGGNVLLILSGNDLTAREFVDISRASKQWRQLLAAPRVTRYELTDATHTFSRREWRDQVATMTSEWVRSW